MPVRRVRSGPQPRPRALVRRQALESLCAVAAVAALVGVLLLLFGKPAAFQGERTGDRATGAAATAANPGTPAGRGSPAVVSSPVPVLVLNNSRISGLARRAATAFGAGGWPVRGTGNYTGRTPVTTVYYPTGQEAVARQFAARYPAVRRVLPRPASLPGSGLTVVVTREFRP